MKSLLPDPEHGACPEVWLMYSVTLYWEKLIFLFQTVISRKYLLV